MEKHNINPKRNSGKASNYSKSLLFIFPCVLSFFMLFFTGCSEEKPSEYDGYYIYGLDANETAIMSEKYSPKAVSGKQLIKETLERMQKEPDDIAMKKVIPDDVVVDDYQLSATGELSLYFSASYGNYTGVNEILRRAAIVKTFCQFPDVLTIQFYVAGQPLTNSNSNVVGQMNADTFIDNTSSDNKGYTQSTTLNMYFADATGNKLVEIPVKVTYDATIPVEQLAVEQLILGTSSIRGVDDKVAISTVPKDTVLNKISVKENICYVDFSSEFLNKRPNISSEVAIYSVVNTLVELSDINKVQFSIDGEQVLLYNETISFGDAFERNLDLVADEE